MRPVSILSALALLGVIAIAAPAARAAETAPLPGTVVMHAKEPFARFVAGLKAAIAKHHMGLVGDACASCGAKAIGVTIPGNRVLMIFNPHYAVRMLKASVPAGIEAPLRLYVTENADGTATLTYRKPTAVFAPYGSKDLDAMAKELDPVVAAIAHDAGAR